MTLLKPGETVEVRPEGEDKLPVYRLRAPLVYDRVKLESAVTRQGGRQHGRVGLLRALRRDVVTFMAESPEEDRKRILGWVDAAIAGWRDFGRRVAAGEFQGDDVEATARELTEAYEAVAELEAPLAPVEAQLRGAGGHYANACAEDSVYQEIFAIEAARLFLVGWEGLAADFAAGPQGVSDAALMAVPAAHLAVIGARVESLLKPDEATAKNSSGPSSGAFAGKPSTASKKQQKKARSKPRTAAPTPGTSPS